MADELGVKVRRCHGNRALQHFKRRCRARSWSNETINAAIQMHLETERVHKRKRDPVAGSTKSLSQLSLSQGRSKKIKASEVESSPLYGHVHSQLYKLSSYLKMPRRRLLHWLHLQLNCSLIKKREQNFVLTRLQWIDRQFSLERTRYLYRIYFDLGVQEQIWPVSVLVIHESYVSVCLFHCLRQGYSTDHRRDERPRHHARACSKLLGCLGQRHRSMFHGIERTVVVLSVDIASHGHDGCATDRICSFASPRPAQKNKLSGESIQR